MHAGVVGELFELGFGRRSRPRGPRCLQLQRGRRAAARSPRPPPRRRSGRVRHQNYQPNRSNRRRLVAVPRKDHRGRNEPVVGGVRGVLGTTSRREINLSDARAPQRRRNLVGDGTSSAHRRAVPLLAVHQILMVSSLACHLLQTASARVRRPRRRRHSALIPLARSTASEKLRSATRFSRIDRAFATLGAHVATRHGMRWPPRCRRGCVT